MKENKSTINNHSLNLFVSQWISPKKMAGIAVKVPNLINYPIIELLLNKLFAEQNSDKEFEFLTGNILQIELIDANLFIGLTYRSNKISCVHFENHPTKATSTLSINVSDSIRLIKQEIDPDTLFFNRKLKISGETEFAHRVKNVVDTLDPSLIPKSFIPILSGYQRMID